MAGEPVFVLRLVDGETRVFRGFEARQEFLRRVQNRDEELAKRIDEAWSSGPEPVALSVAEQETIADLR